MKGQHDYQVIVTWTGNTGTGTSDYRSYERSHTIQVENKAEILGSADAAYRGDNTRHNPEDLLVASLSTCHMLWYLHLCSEAGVIVTDYQDNATGKMIETSNGSGYFVEVFLNPVVTVTEDSMLSTANQLHERANQMCYVANSVNFPVHHNPKSVLKLG